MRTREGTEAHGDSLTNGRRHFRHLRSSLRSSRVLLPFDFDHLASRTLMTPVVTPVEPSVFPVSLQSVTGFSDRSRLREGELVCEKQPCPANGRPDETSQEILIMITAPQPAIGRVRISRGLAKIMLVAGAALMVTVSRAMIPVVPDGSWCVVRFAEGGQFYQRVASEDQCKAAEAEEGAVCVPGESNQLDVVPSLRNAQ